MDCVDIDGGGGGGIEMAFVYQSVMKILVTGILPVFHCVISQVRIFSFSARTSVVLFLWAPYNQQSCAGWCPWVWISSSRLLRE